MPLPPSKNNVNNKGINMSTQTAAELLVTKMQDYGVEYIFCVPGASIDPILNVLADRGPKVILCHHESCAGYMAAAWGKITGKPGVVLVTAGPGATNVVSSIGTAYTEHAPMIAISGQMGSRTKFKRTHQVIDAASMIRPVSKWSHEIDNVETVGSVWDEAYQLAIQPDRGPVHIAIASDFLKLSVNTVTPTQHSNVAKQIADAASIKKLIEVLDKAQKPLLIVGGGVSHDAPAAALQTLVKHSKIPVVCTFEGAGTLSRELESHFMGRLGVFQNQPCNELIREADVILSVGYNIAELDPLTWNKENKNTLIHINDTQALVDTGYQPAVQLLGDIAHNLLAIAAALKAKTYQHEALQQKIRKILVDRLAEGAKKSGFPIHPLRIIHDLRQVVSDDNTVCTDVGSHQYWMSEYFYSYRPKHFLSSMGFQTMGVSIPFAIAATLARPGHKVFSVSGDGSFLMCSMEIATAVALKAPIVHLVWKDHSFNLVQLQEEKKYGRNHGAVFGTDIDVAKYAESLGATGISVKSAEELLPALKRALIIEGPVVIDVPVDYSDNASLVN
jgi:acetolactate synthase-1/2/3 large subunit